ncbi:MAG TPA: aspartyl protease family protein [Pyrinomonadaceae bacterium]
MRHTLNSIKYSLLILIFVSLPIDVHAQQRRKGTSTRKIPGPTAQFVSGRSALRIPLELDNNIILMRVRVNNSQPLKFIFDTGASASVISPELAKQLGLKTEGRVRGTATGGSIEASMIKGVTLSVEGAKVSNQLIAAISFGAISCFKFDGVLGYDFINQFVVEIDYTNSVMNLYDPKSFSYSGKGEVIPISLADRTPLTNAKIVLEAGEPIVANLVVDTGGDGTFVINSPFVDRHKLVEAIPKTIDGSSVGAGVEQKRLLGRVKAVQLGRLIIENPTVALARDTEGTGASDDNHGIIGGEIFRRFKVILDYSRKQMILEANKSFGDPYEVGMSGINFETDEKDCKALKIGSIGENSAAAEAGLQPGDIITAIAGTPTSRISSEQLEIGFKQHGRQLALTVQRGAALLAKRITLRRAI